MKCADVERWLDQGSPPATHMEAMGHARICARCLAVLRAADELETWLASAAPPAPAGFLDRVMERVAVTAPVRSRIPVSEILPFFQALPWWVRVALEPAALLATLLASVLVWRGDTLFALATGGAVQITAWLARAFPAPGPAPPAGAADAMVAIWLQPAVLTGIVLAAAPLALMGSRLLYRWSESLAGPRPLRSRER